MCENPLDSRYPNVVKLRPLALLSSGEGLGLRYKKSLT